MNNKTFKCCFCGKEFKGYGNNPYPVNQSPNARCCDKCNEYVVLARIARTKKNNRKQESEIK